MGIIPAHAGFTRRWCVALRGWRDHPRTRGVYPGVSGRRQIFYGSSPHTRGLRHPVIGNFYYSGIIPAHAGFTAEKRTPVYVAEDHPRTRGVYLLNIDMMVVGEGSSPHTRGLRGSNDDIGAPCRIIPAHAGFTRISTISRSISRDHPRTRGVYPDPDATTWPTSGSSPHTRGLHLWFAWVNDRSRIIPAHAGFTR